MNTHQSLRHSPWLALLQQNQTRPQSSWSKEDMHYQTSVLAAGLNESDIEITVLNKKLSVVFNCENSKSFVTQNTMSWSFPEDARVDEVSAVLNKGVLVLTVPRSEPTQPKKITVVSMSEKTDDHDSAPVEQ